MQATRTYDVEEARAGRSGLAELLVTLAALGAGLYLLTGPPHPPAAWPSVPEVLAVLRGSEPPVAAMGYLLTTAAWLLWLWVVGSLALRCAVVLSEALSHGAAWAHALRRLSDYVTLPLVRRVVDGALVAVVVVHLVGRAPTAMAAEPPVAAAATAPREDAAAERAPRAAQPAGDGRAVAYAVQPGDSLWGIAERFYGAGEEYPRLVAANVGRAMPGGERFDARGAIQPGWVLTVPLPGQQLEQDGEASYYVVAEGDSLRSIAARFLGDEMRWPVVFEANRGEARLPDGRTLADPDLIWPGLRLRMPGEPARPAPVLRAPDRDDPGLRRPATVPPAPLPPSPAPPPAPPLPAAVPTAVSTAMATAPAAAPSPTVASQPAPGTNRATLLYGVGGAAGLAALGGAAMVARRRFRRSLDELPAPDEPAGDAVLDGAFAEAELARALAHRLHGGEADAATLVAARVRRFYAEHDVDLGIVTVAHGRRRTALTLEARLEDQPRVVELASELGTLLGAAGRAELASETNDVRLELDGLPRAGLPAADEGDLPWLVPVGALPSREFLLVDWRELGHVLVAGVPGEGAETVLTSLVAALAARCRPDELELRTIAHRRTLPPEIGALPHQPRPAVDPGDHDAVRALIEEVQAELDRRMRAPSEDAAGRPRLVLVVGELADLPGEGLLDTIGEYGPAHGVHVLAASTRTEALDRSVLGHFATRAVLRLNGEEESTRLLRVGAAEDLGAGGDMLLRVESRAPVHLRGFRVAPEALAELVRLMRGAYATPDDRPAGSADGPIDPAAPVGTVPEADGQGPMPAVDEAPAEAAEPSVEPPVPAADGAADGGPAQVSTATANEADAYEDRADVRLEDMQAAAPPAAAGTNGHGANGHTPAGQAPALVLGQDDAAEPPLQVVCFGGPRLLYRGEQIWPPDRGKFKHWEVLVFLAAQPTGTVARGVLCNALWRKDGLKDIAHALNQQLSTLRQEVRESAPDVPGTFVTHLRSGMCALDPALVSSDVRRFVALCEEAKTLPEDQAKEAYREARALYGADLLTERDYEWIDDRDESGLTLRELYREMHRRATKDLADLHLRDREPAAAVPLYRELLQDQPRLEGVLRSLFRCYRQLGDRNSLIREERRLREVLEEDAAKAGDPALAQPDPKTSALFEQALRELEIRSGAAAE